MFFIVFYTVEMSLKILAMGFVFNKGAYLKDYWNIMDVLVVTTSWLPLILTDSSINLKPLRALRILRPLRTIKNIKALRKLLVALIYSLPLMKDVFIL